MRPRGAVAWVAASLPAWVAGKWKDGATEDRGGGVEGQMRAAVPVPVLVARDGRREESGRWGIGRDHGRGGRPGGMASRLGWAGYYFGP